MIEPYGSVGWLVRHGSPRAIARRFAKLGADVVIGAEAVAVFGASEAEVRRAAESPAADVPAEESPPIVVPARYDGPDLAAIASRAGLSPREVALLHAERTYEAELLGFAPGFAYLGELDPRLRFPRLPSPRPRVAPGTLAIAERYTGVYPLPTPGGWNAIGRILGPPWFDPARDPPALVRVGTRVRFEPHDEGEPRSLDLQPSPVPTRPALVVYRASGLATVQDLGRPGFAGEGLPGSGASDPRALVRANRAVGNADGAAGIELAAGSLELQAIVEITLAVGDRTTTLAAGERTRFLAPAWIALEGGIDVPLRAGSRSTHLVAALGGHAGRALARGDVLGRGTGDGSVFGGELDEPREEELLFDPGPDSGAFPVGALDLLEAGPWTVSPRSDRVGTRLDGPRLLGLEGRTPPLPMWRGSVEVTSDGTPIVLGPDHPTTGGYPVLAVLRARSSWDLAHVRPGGRVRLRRAQRLSAGNG